MSSSDHENEATIGQLMRAARDFEAAREWGRFHDPKNLAMALASEVGELASILRWVPNEESDAFVEREDNRARLRDEIGDVGICLLLLCARAGVDLDEAVKGKLRKNADKYPAEAARGHPDPL